MMKETKSKSKPTAATSQAPTPPPSPSATPSEKLRIRGTLTVIDPVAHDYEFRAQRSTGQPSQEVVKTIGASKLYRTTAQREKKLVAHLSVPADAADPAAELRERLQKLTRQMELSTPPPLGGRVLMQSDQLRVTLNQEQRRVECTLQMQLDAERSLNQTLITLMQQISQCFAINQTSLAPRRS